MSIQKKRRNKLDILQLNKEQILSLERRDICRVLTAEEIVHIAKTLGAFWSYDREKAPSTPGYHALLKSGHHSDGFFISRILLQHENILEILAEQLAMHIFKHSVPLPKKIAGIPDGATRLGEEVAKILGFECAEMKKENGKISMVSKLKPGETLLLVEDFCTRGTGFREAVTDIKTQYPKAVLFPYELVILNRGGMEKICCSMKVGPIHWIEEKFEIIAAAEYRIQDWEEDECPLCKKFGSKPIKPKESDENWRLITTAQKG